MRQSRPSVLRFVAVHIAVCCSVLRCVAVCCGVLRCVAVCCNVLRRVAVHAWRRMHASKSP